MSRESWKNGSGRSRSEPSDLDWKTRQPLDLSGVTRGYRGTPSRENARSDLNRPFTWDACQRSEGESEFGISRVLGTRRPGHQKCETPRVNQDRPSIWDACQKSVESQDIRHREIEFPRSKELRHHKSRNWDLDRPLAEDTWWRSSAIDVWRIGKSTFPWTRDRGSPR
jgi:hypothetical protein